MVPQRLNLLADENVSPRVVTFLREKGCDVIDVKEKGWYGAEDKFLIIEVLDKFLKIEKEMAERTIIILTDKHLRIRPIIT